MSPTTHGRALLRALFLAALVLGTPSRSAAEVVLSPCDDCSSDAVPLGFTIKFFDREFDKVYVNNNGNLTFDSALGAYTPFGLAGTNQVIIAPFFADVDTRSRGMVAYGVSAPYQFNADWTGVGYFNSHSDKGNSFSVSLFDRSDAPEGLPGDFDIRFSYFDIDWETGDASGGTNGLGGSSAHVGFSNGTGAPGTSYEFPGSGVPGAFLNSNAATSLSGHMHNAATGVYYYEIRNGTIAGADLALTKVVTPEQAGVGKDLTYTLRASNRGPKEAPAVQIIDTLPAGVTFKSGSPGCTNNAGTVICQLTNLAPGDFATADIVVTRTTADPISNQATVLSSAVDLNPANDIAIADVGTVPPCYAQLLSRSAPKSVTLHPGAEHPARKKLKLAVINKGNTPIDISEITAPGAPFVIEKIKPHVPRRVPKHDVDLFTIRVAVAAGLPEVTASRPYFTIRYTCAGVEGTKH